MSDIEGNAQPVLTPLITGQIGIPIDPLAARSIAMFAFDKAVVQDHANRSRTPFFSRRIRHAFRERLTIPPDVNVWICAIKDHGGGGRVKTLYFNGNSPLGNSLHMYAYTFAFGYFACQVLAVKQIWKTAFRSLPGFENIAIPIWPGVLSNLVWPVHHAIDNTAMLEDFAMRWARIELIDL
ncbi:MAG TPA: hypothetical protein VMV57_06420 [Terracidiphilus sp.]|nr:hypothetical protein [Terracidiphilus sp.]